MPHPLPDSRNADIQVWVGDGLVHRDDAKVSVFDSVVQGGDAVWEGLRVYDGKVAALDAHLDRLFASAHAMAFAGIPERAWVRDALFQTLKANGMLTDTHVRLTLTRGPKTSSSMNPAFNVYGCTLIVLAEWKPPIYDGRDGVRLITSAIRRNGPQFVDSKIHHNNLINNILAKIQANVAGFDAALMLDDRGFASEANGTNVFFAKRGVLLTPTADSCLPGITRATVLTLARGAGIPTQERNISLTEVYTCDEAFMTGTMGELTPILEVDGRGIGSGVRGDMTERLQALYAEHVADTGTPIT